MRIALFSHDFPPVNRIGALRVFSFAKAWARAGHEITVFTIQPMIGAAPISFEADFRGLAEMEVIRLPFFGWSRPKAGGLSSGDACSSARCGSTVGKLRRLSRLISRDLPLGLLRDPGLLSLSPTLRRLTCLHRRKPFDFLLTSFPTPSAHLLGALFKRRFGCVWVADYRDLWSGGHLYKAIAPFDRLQRTVEHWCVSHADMLVVINDIHRELIGRNFTAPISVAPNGFENEDYPSPDPVSAGQAHSDRMRRLVYTGTIFGRHRYPKALLETLEIWKREGRIEADRLNVAFYSSDSHELQREVERRGLSSIVTFHGHVSRREVVAQQRNADALLFCDWTSPEDPGHMSGKIFEYLGANRPIISVGGVPGSPPSRLIEDCGAGVWCGNDVALLDKILTAVVRGQRFCEPADDERRMAFSRNTIAMGLIDEISKLVEAKSGVK